MLSCIHNLKCVDYWLSWPLPLSLRLLVFGPAIVVFTFNVSHSLVNDVRVEQCALSDTMTMQDSESTAKTQDSEL